MTTEELKEMAGELEQDARQAARDCNPTREVACYQAAASYRIVAELKEIDRSLGCLQ